MVVIFDLILLLVIFQLSLALGSFCTWFERKGSALIQDRVGANRAGRYIDVESVPVLLRPLLWGFQIAGLLGVINTLFCDPVKGIFKEDFVPDGTNKFMHTVAPYLAVVPIIMAFAVIPIGPSFFLWGHTFDLQLAHVDAGILFILAMGSVAVYGVALAGWAGNNKFSLLGALRASAQMISYELAMGAGFAAVIVVYGTLDLSDMVQAQRGLLWGFLPNWGIFTQPLTCFILFVVGMAETKRGPFDMPESESELVAGYFTEYSGMKFLLFWLGEFAEIGLFSLIIAVIFLGAWQIPYVELPPTWWAALVGHAVLMTKVILLCMLQIIIRWTLPRFRYDHLLNLGWKGLLPLSIINVLFYGALKVGGVL